MKTCIVCHKLLPLEAFGIVRASPDGRNARCRDCKKVQDHAYYLANKENLAAANRRWVETHPEQSRAIKNRWAHENPDKIREARRKRERTIKGRLYRNVKRSRRRARERANGGSHTVADRLDIYFRQNGCCFYCGTYLSLLEGGHYDHVIPIAKGGSNGPENLVFSCPRCNHQKSDRLPADIVAEMLELNRLESAESPASSPQ